MVTLQKVDNAIRFTFEQSSFYLYNDGMVDVPLNALTLVLDEADMANFVKASSNDNLFSIPMSELSQFADKAALQSWFEENAYGGTGGGGGGLTPEEVQGMIDTSIQPVEDEVTIVDGDLQDHVSDTTAHTTAQEKAAWNAKADASSVYTKAQVDAALSGKADASDLEALIDELDVKEEVIASAITSLQTNKLDASAYTPTDLSQYWTSAQTEAAITSATSGKADSSDVYTKTEANTLLAGKLDVSAYTPTDLSQYWTSAQTEAAISTATSGKQNTLIAGSGISIANDVISVTGGSVTVDPTLDSGSTNPVANSAITQAIIDNELVVSTALNQLNNSKQNILTAGSGISINNDVISVTGGGGSVTVDPSLNSGSTNPVANSAITAAIDAKQNTLTAGSGISIANDVISVTGGGSVTVDPTLDSGSTNPVANSAITNGFNAYTLKADNHEGIKRYFYVSSPASPYGDLAIWNFSINGRCPLSQQTGGANTAIDKFNLVETSAITTSMTSSSTDAQVPSAKAVYDQFGGLKLVKCTQAEYSAMEQAGTLDASTLYIISNVVNP